RPSKSEGGDAHPTITIKIVSYLIRDPKHLLCIFIDKLDLDPDLMLNHPKLPSVLSYGTLAA
ncbi:hypothetical protein QUB19_26040, partial [Microcoleus sp. B4-C5]